MAGFMGPKEEAAVQTRGNRLAEAIVALVLCALAFAITILVLLTENVIGTDGTCYLTTNSIDVCRYGIAVCIIGFLLSIVMVFALCRPPLVTAGVATLGSVWWLAFAITASAYTASASSAGLPQGHYRACVVGLAWATFVCEALAAGIAAHLYTARWHPAEMGASNAVEEYGQYRKFKERQEAEARAKAAPSGSGAGRLPV